MTPKDMQLDPFDIPMIFLRVGWMDRYQGITVGDSISGGGAYVAKHGFGHEIFNFQPFLNGVYGYVQPTGRKDKWSEATIKLEQLGASKADESAPGVLAIWVATSPIGGGFVVGWYKNATIFRKWHPPPAISVRRYKGTDCGYYVTARAEDAVLLPRDDRVFRVPQQEKGGFGQSNIWYANDREQHRQFRLDVLSYVETGKLPTVLLPESLYAHRQPDPLLRQRVEQIAIKMTSKYFTRRGYCIDSVEQDNVGWDLNAVLGKRELKLEVKGLSGSQIVVDLTPNEYTAMQKHRDSYRVCVVTNALTKPCLTIFAYSPDSGQWEGPGQKRLNIQEIKSARCSAI
jgi:hypothetical protein